MIAINLTLDGSIGAASPITIDGSVTAIGGQNDAGSTLIVASDTGQVRILDLLITAADPDTLIACAGTDITVPFTVAGTDPLMAGNMFMLQLSDSSGSFDNDTTIAMMMGTTSGILTGTLPFNLPQNTQYRVRVISTMPRASGPDNGTDITIYPVANKPTISANGSTTLCQGDSVQLEGPPGAFGYLWNTNSQAQNIIVQTPGDYAAKITSMFGCLSRYSDTITVTVDPLPATPAVSIVNTDSLTSSVMASSYVWLLNGAATWFTSQTIMPIVSGSYSVIAVSVNGCASDTSAAVAFTITGLSTVQNLSGNVSIFPNPSAGTVTISSQEINLETVRVTDLAGRTIMSRAFNGHQQMNITVRTAGLYFITLTTTNGDRMVSKLVVK